MLNEVLRYLDLAPGKIVVDATIGTGGHSQEILKRIAPSGTLIGIDRDQESLDVCRDRLADFNDSLKLVHGNFADIESLLNGLDIDKVDAILFDLGISSFQLEDPKRGFSFQKEGPLDMRLDRTSYISAYDLVNNLNEDEISAMLWNFGQERWHNRIAHLLVQERQRQPITTTEQLASIVTRSIPGRYQHKYHRIHPATRTFQAVRIAVNRELEVLEGTFDKAINLLKKGGRICIISFHSLEDRIAKLTLRKNDSEGLIEILTPKPLTPELSEIAVNPKSRSSKLRAAERL